MYVHVHFMHNVQKHLENYFPQVPVEGLPFGEVSNAKTKLIASGPGGGQMANVESAILENYLSATALWQKFVHGSLWFLYPEYFNVRKPATGA